MIKIKQSIEFCQEIEKRVRESKETYLDTISEYCKECNIEIEKVPRLLNKQIKTKIELEAEALNLLKKKKKRSKLPF